jgi:hypothetical protein
MGPEKNVRLRLPRDCSAYDFLRAVIRNPRIDINTRIAAALGCLPYEKPRLIAVVQDNGSNPNERVIRIVGGMPRLPGTDTIMPGDPPRPKPAVNAPKVVTREVEVGTCTAETDQLSVK